MGRFIHFRSCSKKSQKKNYVLMGAPATFGTMIFVAGYLTVTSIQAQSADDKAAADALFDSARTQMEAKNYSRACPQFKDSHALDPAVGTLLNLGLCYKSAGKTASAWSTYREAASLARQMGQTEREELARQETKALDPKLTRLIIKVSDAARNIDKLTISRDGKALPQTMWGISLAVDPGEVQIEATAPGYTSKSSTVLARGEGKTFTFRVPPLNPSAPPLLNTRDKPADSEEASVEQKKQSSGSRPPTHTGDDSASRRSSGPWILGGVGLAGGIGGTVLAFMSKSENDKATELCTPTGRCDSKIEFNNHTEYVSNAKSYATGAYIAWGVGGAALVGATIWYIVDTPTNESAFSLEPIVGKDTWGLSAHGTF